MSRALSQRTSALLKQAHPAASQILVASSPRIRGMAASDVQTGPSVISMINEDHRLFKQLWNEYNGPNMNGEMKQKLGWSLIRAIAMHSAAEEEVMYPEIRKRLGSEAADHLLGDDGHQAIKKLLFEANYMSVEKNGEATYTAKLSEAMKVLFHHIEDEETRTWPRFESLPGVDADLLSHLGMKFDAAKHHAVTRPHPWAPNKPPLNVLANTMTSPLDGALDMWRFGGNPPRYY